MDEAISNDTDGGRTSPRVLVDIGHPAHVHFFRPIIDALLARGSPVRVAARQKDVSLELLNEGHIPFALVGAHAKTSVGKTVQAIVRTAGLLSVAADFRPDFVMGVHNPYVAWLGSVTGATSIVYIDGEHVRHDEWLTFPFADVILTPRSFRRDLGPKHVRMNAFKELAYLHPTRFAPDPSVLEEAGVPRGSRLVVLRFVDWTAKHDRGQAGFTEAQKIDLVRSLEGKARVVISSEGRLPRPLEDHRLTLRPSRLHHLLAQADLLVTESGTMSTEAAILGIPVVLVNTLVGSIGNFEDLEKRYGLLFGFRNGAEALLKVHELMTRPGIGAEWREKRNRLLEDSADPVEVVLDLIDATWANSRARGG